MIEQSGDMIYLVNSQKSTFCKISLYMEEGVALIKNVQS